MKDKVSDRRIEIQSNLSQLESSNITTDINLSRFNYLFKINENFKNFCVYFIQNILIFVNNLHKIYFK
jgi:hypothetical protein